MLLKELSVVVLKACDTLCLSLQLCNSMYVRNISAFRKCNMKQPQVMCVVNCGGRSHCHIEWVTILKSVMVLQNCMSVVWSLVGRCSYLHCHILNGSGFAHPHPFVPPVNWIHQDWIGFRTWYLSERVSMMQLTAGMHYSACNLEVIISFSLPRK